MNVLIINLKKSVLPIISFFFIFCLLLFSNYNIQAAQDGLKLWATAVVPSLFPFFIATEILYCTNIIDFLGNHTEKFMKKVFNLPGEAIFPIFMGIISGYPTGAKIVSNLRKDKKITKTEGEHLLPFTNNSGPLFILGTVGVSIFCNSSIGLLLLITHLLSTFTIGFLFKFWKPNRNSSINYKYFKKESNSNLSFSTIIVNSISKSITTILNIGGFIVLFSVLISILKHSNILFIISNLLEHFGISPNLTESFFTGIFELTNGIKSLSIIGTKDLTTTIVTSSFLLGFGGISVALQVYSNISDTDLSLKPYLIGKILHGLISAIYCYIGLKLLFY